MGAEDMPALWCAPVAIPDPGVGSSFTTFEEREGQTARARFQSAAGN